MQALGAGVDVAIRPEVDEQEIRGGPDVDVGLQFTLRNARAGGFGLRHHEPYALFFCNAAINGTAASQNLALNDELCAEVIDALP
jgi:hypothetical protein